MAKRVRGYVNCRFRPEATPAPPIGPRWASMAWQSWSSASSTTSAPSRWPVRSCLFWITVYEDQLFSFVTKTPPAADCCAGRPESRKDPADRIRIRSAESPEIKYGRSPKSRCGSERCRSGRRHQAGRGHARSMGIEVVAGPIAVRISEWEGFVPR